MQTCHCNVNEWKYNSYSCSYSKVFQFVIRQLSRLTAAELNLCRKALVCSTSDNLTKYKALICKGTWIRSVGRFAVRWALVALGRNGMSTTSFTLQVGKS